MSSRVYLKLDDQEAHDLHHALATTISLMDQVGAIPKEAPLYGARPRLVRIARRLDHEARHKGAFANPHDVDCECCRGSKDEPEARS